MIEMIEFEAYAETDISDACHKSVVIAKNRKKPETGSVHPEVKTQWKKLAVLELEDVVV